MCHHWISGVICIDCVSPHIYGAMQSFLSQLVIFVCITCVHCFSRWQTPTKLFSRGRHHVRLSDAIENAPDMEVQPHPNKSSTPSPPIDTVTAVPKKYVYQKPSPEELRAFNSNKSYPCSSERYRQGLNAVNYEKWRVGLCTRNTETTNPVIARILNNPNRRISRRNYDTERVHLEIISIVFALKTGPKWARRCASKFIEKST